MLFLAIGGHMGYNDMKYTLGAVFLDAKIAELKEIIDGSDNIVFFGGAGVSTESGIPDFRSVDGLYNQKYKYPPETMLSHTFFVREPEEFYKFYHDKLVVRGAKPNAAHIKLAQLEAQGKLKAVITQNIDGLHQQAGSKNVLELHGSVHRCYCARCRKPYSEEAINDCDGVPTCDCGGVIRPDVVLYEEGLDEDVINKAVQAIMNADVLIIGGTSLVVYPAAGFIDYYRGNKLVLINRDATSRDSGACLVIRDKIGEVFSQI
jgi:NAD-dependent deacetylase